MEQKHAGRVLTFETAKKASEHRKIALLITRRQLRMPMYPDCCSLGSCARTVGFESTIQYANAVLGLLQLRAPVIYTVEFKGSKSRPASCRTVHGAGTRLQRTVEQVVSTGHRIPHRPLHRL